MNAGEAAGRLGVAEHQVARVIEHVGGHIAELVDGRRMLIGPTASRVFVPEVDGPDTQQDRQDAERKPARRTRRKTREVPDA